MDPLKASAKFTAFVWYSNRKKGNPQSAQFARDNWPAFLPFADEGLGRLLMKVAELEPTRKRKEIANKVPARDWPAAGSPARDSGKNAG